MLKHQYSSKPQDNSHELRNIVLSKDYNMHTIDKVKNHKVLKMSKIFVFTVLRSHAMTILQQVVLTFVAV